jgi:hypothetical protein
MSLGVAEPSPTGAKWVFSGQHIGATEAFLLWCSAFVIRLEPILSSPYEVIVTTSQQGQLFPLDQYDYCEPMEFQH